MQAAQKEYLERRVAAGTEKIAGLCDALAALDGSAGKSVANAQGVIARLDDMHDQALNREYAKVLEGLEKLQGIRKGGGSSKKEDLLRLNELIGELRECLNPLLQAVYSLLHWDRIAGIFSLVQRYMEMVIREKQQTGVLSFRDVQLIAIAVLKKSRSVRNYYKSQFKYIMIDEFQDNNDMQKRLLYLLAEGIDLFEEEPGPEHLEKGKLFFVGDEKQSIYRFRGADVRVFKNLREEIEDAGGRHILLPYNYRSRSGLIGFFNALFKNIFAPPADEGAGEDGCGIGREERAYEAEFAPLRTGGGSKENASVRLLFKPYEESADPSAYGSNDEAEAFTVARFIRDAVDGGKLSVGKEADVRPAGYDDFALLMRSTGNQVIYERAFRRFDIPYATESVRTLFLEAPFNDIYYALQLSVYHGDRTAYAAFLRSPFVNLSDDTVLRILLGNTPPFTEEEESVSRDPEEGERYRIGRDLFRFLSEHAPVRAITELVTHLWYDTGYRFHLLKNPAHHTYLEYFDYLYQLCLDADRRGVGLTEFLDFLRKNLGKYERLEDFETLKESKHGVHILTVHKSKGLEYPVVILANTGNLGRGSSEGLYYLSEEFGLTFGLGGGEKKGKNYFFERGRQEEKLKETAELKRLLYVACTRARDHLVISGCHHKGNQNSENAVINMVLKALSVDPAGEPGPVDIENGAGGVTVQWERIRDIDRGILVQKTGGAGPPDLRAVADMYRKAEEISFPVCRNSFAATEFDPEFPKSAAGTDGYREEQLPPIRSDGLLKNEAAVSAFGTLTHYILERKIRGNWERDAIPGTCLSRFAPEMREQVINDACMLCDRFFTTEAWRKLRAEARTVHPEMDFILQYDDCGMERFIHGRIDLFFETEGSAFIVDFKTDRKVIPGLYINQMKIYRAAVEEFTDLPVTCLLCFLRGPRTVEIETEGPLRLEFPGG
jgi:ATP-dependent exoDNAse (exonuclease V) beta subunit